MKNQVEHYGGRIKGLVSTVAKMVAEKPEYAKNLDYLHATLKTNIEGYGVKSECFNCKRSMKITIYTADLLDALLILAMAQEVKDSVKNGTPFSAANKIHLPTLKTTQGILKRSTKCDYLGLIKQPKEWRGSGYWLLTGWAWKALRGEKIPKSVKYWEGHLIGRSEELTTLGEMFRTHVDLIRLAIEKRRAVRTDYRSNFGDYKPSDWSDFGGYVEDEN